MTEMLFDCDTHFTDHLPHMWEGLGLPDTLVPAIDEAAGSTRLRLGDRLFPRPSGPGSGNPKGLGHLIGQGHDDDRAEFMDAHGIAAAVLQPGFVGLSVQALPEPGQRTELIAKYNDLAAAACTASRLDLRFAVLLSVEDPEWSLAELRRWATDPHAVGVVVRPTARVPEARTSNPAFHPVLAAAAEERMTLFVHGGTGCYQWSPLADAYDHYVFTHAFGHMGEHMVALTDLLCSRPGLPDGLRVVLLEGGTSWIPAVVDRLASHVSRLSEEPIDPWARLREHVAVVPDPGEPHAAFALELIGYDNVLFGSDYPHWDTVESAEWRKAFGADVTSQRLVDNTARFVPRLNR